MNVFPIEPKFEIGKVGFSPDANGHSHDLLNRGEFGQRLTDLVDRTEQPLVIALDGPWGSGKSHFLKLWAGAHKLDFKGQAEVIYFDAFEHDFLDDPLVSLVAKLAKDAPERGLAANAMKKVKTAAAPLLKMGARIGLAVVAAGGSEVVGAVGDAAIGAIGKSAEEKIDQFWKTETTRIAAMSEFREALEALTKKEDGTTQKIVFIIDELDRCRPDYALQMLEIIKHFFTVPNVHFVLGANLTELENSVKARYGAGINGRKYLQKFVMLEMRLPDAVSRTPTWEAYFYTAKNPHDAFRHLNIALNSALVEISKRQLITIRDIQRILTVVNLGQNYLIGEDSRVLLICVDMIIASVLRQSDFRDFRNQRVTLKALYDALNLDLFGPLKDTPRNWAWASLLCSEELGHQNIEFLQKELGYLIIGATDHWGNVRSKTTPLQWRDLHYTFSQVFDTFTLPTP